MGCSAQPTFPLVGQFGHNRAKARKQSQAAPHPEQLRAANIARGTSGPLLLVDPMFSENVAPSGLAHKEKLPT